jgi:isocitrate/isopropylmalate dehydrogenase
MLRHLGLTELAEGIQKALLATFAAGIRTPDLGGNVTTNGFAKAVSERLSA